MDLDEARAYVRANRNAVLATLKKDGTPAMSPITAVVDDEGRIVVSTRETAYKVGHLRRDPRGWLCVLPDGFFGEWHSLAGTAEIVSLPAAMDGLVDYYRRAAGEHEDWDDYRTAMTRDRRCLLRFTLTAAGPDRQG